MSGICADMDTESILRAKAYYEELLSSLSRHYDSFHRVIYQFLCIVGVIANICVIVVLLRPVMRKNPFNLFLVAIAICDMSLMASYFVYKQIELCHPLYFTFFWIVYTYAYAVLSVFVHSASLWMTVNMAVLRYLVLRNSANSSRRWPRLNTYKAASLSVAAALLIAAIGSAPNMLRYQIYYNGLLPVPRACLANGSRYASEFASNSKVHAYVLTQPSFWNCNWERFSFWTAGVCLKLVPCLLLTIFMTLLVRMLVEARERRNRLQGGMKQPPPSQQVAAMSNLFQQHQPLDSARSQSSGAEKAGGGGQQGKAQAERTTAMLTIIVAVFLITELPQGILVIAIGVRPQVRFAMTQLSNIIDLLSLLNSSVNFILYATMSNLFRHEFLQTFGQCCPRRFFDWLKKREGAEKSSPIGAGAKEQQTMLTGVNGAGGGLGANSKLIRLGTPDPMNNSSPNLMAASNGSPSPSKLAVTGQEISKIARKGIRQNAGSPTSSNNRCRLAEGECNNKRSSISRQQPPQGSLPVAIASAAVNLAKRVQQNSSREEAVRSEQEEEQRRRLLIENGNTSNAGTAAGTPRRE